MQSGDAVPRVTADTPLSAALLEISAKGLGMTTVVDDQGHLAGIFTDGDLRRALDARVDINTVRMADLMSRGAKTARRGMLAAAALKTMEEHEITSLVVTENDRDIDGVLHLMHLLHAGIA